MIKVLLTLTLAIFLTRMSFADSSSNTLTTNVSSDSWSRLKENLNISLYTEYMGATNQTKEAATENYLYNSLGFKYKLGNGKLGVNFRTYSYSTDYTLKGDAKVKRSQHEIINPRIGYSNVIYKKGNFSVFNSSVLEIPVNDARTEDKKIIYPRQYNGISYQMNAKHSFDFGILLARWMYEGEQEKTNDKALTVVYEGTHKYAFNDKVALQTIFEIDTYAYTNGIYKDIGYGSKMIYSGPEIALNDKMSLYAAAFFFMDDGKKELDTENLNLFMSFSANLF